MASVSLRSFLQPRYWYAWLILVYLRIMSWFPSRVFWLLGSALGWFFSLFPTPACRVAVRNIELCFPELSPRERRRLVQRHFRLSGYAVISLAIAWWAPKWRVRRFIKLRDRHYLDEALASGKNAILLAPHFIGLDMGGSRVSLEWKSVSMYRKSRNLFLEYLFQRRSRFGAVVVERMSNLKLLIKLIRQGLPFYYLPDQDMGERASVFAPFFGIPAATVTALSRIAESTNAAVIPCVTRILPGGRGYEVRFYPPLENFPSADPVADAGRMNQEIEKWVREMPEQYMWSYRRFKTRPNNEPSLY
jgi:lipid A biosynthesis lauroyl/palmitoleoyl acyltransferase